MLCVTFSSFIFCLPVLTVTLPRYILFLLRSEWMIRTSSKGLWDLQFICCLKLYQFSFIRALPTELQYPQDTDGTRTHDHEVNILKYICCMKTYQNAIFTSVKVKVQFVNYLLFAFLWIPDKTGKITGYLSEYFILHFCLSLNSLQELDFLLNSEPLSCGDSCVFVFHNCLVLILLVYVCCFVTFLKITLQIYEIFLIYANFCSVNLC